MNARPILTLAAAAAVLAACSDSGVAPEPPAEAAAPALLAVPLAPSFSADDASRLESRILHATARPDVVVGPGESIQAAVDAARPGAVIHVEPGTYAQTVVIDKPRIRLMGRRGRGGSGVVLADPGGAANGISVTANGDGVVIANLTVRGFERNGVFMTGVQGFVVMRVTAEDNGEYGIFPARSSDGVMMHNTATGHADAGLYIGQSERVAILHNTVSGNVIGIEASNSSHVSLTHNDARGNTIGILAVLLPPTPFRTVLVAADMRISHNRVVDNDLPNFAEPGSLPSFVPAGSGILVVGVDRAAVERNTVTGNDWVGIGVGSLATFAALAGLPPEAIAGLEPHPDGVVVRGNLATGNGAAPPPGFPLPGVDLLWDGTGTGNCWEKNVYVTSFPPALPAC